MFWFVFVWLFVVCVGFFLESEDSGAVVVLFFSLLFG